MLGKIDKPVTVLFTTKANNSTGQQVNNYKKAVTTLMLPGQQCKGNSAEATVLN